MLRLPLLKKYENYLYVATTKYAVSLLRRFYLAQYRLLSFLRNYLKQFNRVNNEKKKWIHANVCFGFVCLRGNIFST